MRKGGGELLEGQDFGDVYGIQFPRRKNEGVLHWKLKNYIYGFLKEKGYFDFEEEVECDEYRIDIVCISPSNEKIGIEIGDINIHPATDLKKRLKESSKYVDKIYWCPFDYHCFSRFGDVLLSEMYDGNDKNHVDGFMLKGKNIGWGCKYTTPLGFRITEFDFGTMFNTKLLYKEQKELELSGLYKRWEEAYKIEQDLKNDIISLRNQLATSFLNNTSEAE